MVKYEKYLIINLYILNLIISNSFILLLDIIILLENNFKVYLIINFEIFIFVFIMFLIKI